MYFSVPSLRHLSPSFSIFFANSFMKNDHQFWMSTRILLGVQYLRLHKECETCLNLPVQWQEFLTLMCIFFSSNFEFSFTRKIVICIYFSFNLITSYPIFSPVKIKVIFNSTVHKVCACAILLFLPSWMIFQDRYQSFLFFQVNFL